MGLVAFDVDAEGPTAPSALCTGAVISRNAFLTAAHCIAFAPDAQWVVTLRAGRPDNRVAEDGFVYDDFPFDVLVPVHRATEVVVHPEYDRATQANDLAVLVFPPGTFRGVKPIRLPTAGLLDRLDKRGALRGARLTLVGYGSGAEGQPPRFYYPGYRQRGTAPVEGLTPHQLLIDGAARTPDHSGLCLGDSGSPQFLGRHPHVAVSVFSVPAENCRGTARGQRLDTAAARTFLKAFVSTRS